VFFTGLALASTDFDCSRVLTNFRNDDKILEVMQQATDESYFTVQCVENLVAGSHFKALDYGISSDVNNLFSGRDPRELYDAVKRGSAKVNAKFGGII